MEWLWNTEHTIYVCMCVCASLCTLLQSISIRFYCTHHGYMLNKHTNDDIAGIKATKQSCPVACKPWERFIVSISLFLVLTYYPTSLPLSFSFTQSLTLTFCISSLDVYGACFSIFFSLFYFFHRDRLDTRWLCPNLLGTMTGWCCCLNGQTLKCFELNSIGLLLYECVSMSAIVVVFGC